MDNEMRSTIVSPTTLVVFVASGLYFAITGGVKAGGRNPEILQVLLGGFSAPFTQHQIVSQSPALVAMTLDQ